MITCQEIALQKPIFQMKSDTRNVTSYDSKTILRTQAGGTSRGAKNIPIPLLKEPVLIPTGRYKDLTLSRYLLLKLLQGLWGFRCLCMA